MVAWIYVTFDSRRVEGACYIKHYFLLNMKINSLIYAFVVMQLIKLHVPHMLSSTQEVGTF